MSSSFRRRMQRRALREGRITPEQYAKLRRRPPSDHARADRWNAQLVIWAREANKLLKEAAFDGDGSPMARALLNKFEQAHLRETVYHPTKGFRVQRGQHVSSVLP